MINGNASKIYYLENQAIAASQRLITACFWKRYYGSPEQALPGVTCRAILVIGTECTYVITVHKDHWTRIFAAIAAEPDLEYLMVDGSIVRVHQHGAVKKTPGCGGDG